MNKTEQENFPHVLKLVKYSIKIIPLQVKKILRKLFKGLLRYNFRGWGMITHSVSPWEGGINNDTFLQANREIKSLFEFSGAVKMSAEKLSGYLWRHWLISNATRYAIEFTEKKDLEFVECGVGDGVSSYFTLKESKAKHDSGKINSYRMHLYDSFMAMKAKNLLPSETGQIGRYKGISVELVKKNLSNFIDNIVFHQGFIPESLRQPPNAPKSICYLHIDLNSAIPTLKTLEFFFPRLLRGGVIIFDDYGSINHFETKNVVDKFLKEKPGILLPLPTGQAIYYR